MGNFYDKVAKKYGGYGFTTNLPKHTSAEHYLSKQEFVKFLQGVPIFEDFDPEKDEQYLNKYFSEYMQGDNVVLTRHRVVYVVQK